ncbi:MAG: tyrosine-type recombinase/integrase [Chloroflexi bacterium]|nr:tyrosine-type recombinase/integrase [Chloroflexota bacterium]
MKHADVDATAPRLALPRWRIARDATLTELCAAFVDRGRAEGLSPATESYYRRACDHWLRFCHQRGLSDPRVVSPDHLTDYAGWLQAGHFNKQSVATWLRGVRALMSWAELRGYIELSPFRLWKLKQPKLPAQRGFSTGDVRRMVDVASAQAANALRDTAILLLMFDTGVRSSEVCRLRLANILDGDELATSVTVHGKGDKYRRIEMHPQTQRAIFEYLVNERPVEVRCEAVFVARGNLHSRGWHPLSPSGLSQLVNRIAHRAGLAGPRLGPHTMRHGFTQEYLESEGARIEDLQILLGHESITMSLHYAGQAAATARRGSRQYSPVGKLGLHLGKRLQRGRPKKGSL